jgi:hypothetical protein
MSPIAYLKLQAKNLFKDYKTQSSYVDKVDGNTYYEYSPEYFDIDRIFLEYDDILQDCHWHEENLSLMKIQHIFAQMLGFKKWEDLFNAPVIELELTKLLFDNQDKISIEDWDMYISGVENDNQTTLDSETRLDIFMNVFVNVEGHHNPFGSYRLK